MNDQFRGDWPGYLTAIEANHEVKVLGITDYMSVTNYTKILENFRNGRINNIELLIPNIEFRIMPSTDKNKAINIHLIIDPTDKDHVQKILGALGRLHFVYDKEKYACTPEGLRNLGFAHDPNIKDNGAALKHGTEQFKVVFTEFTSWFEGEYWLKSNSLVAVANSGNDGISGLTVSGGWAAVREEILRMAQIILSGNPADRRFFLGKGNEEHRQALVRLGGRKPCIHGSDAHELSKLFQPDQDRFCWIKADCTFEGLRQIIFEPEERVYIGSRPPNLHDETRVVETLIIRDKAGWFESVVIPLNKGLVAVIGRKGSGKSALAELLAAAVGSWDDLEQSSFLARAGHHLNGLFVELLWKDGHKTTFNVGDTAQNKDGVRYLSQRFVERLCAEDHVGAGLVREIEAVIFASLDPTDTLNASNFAELRSIQTERLRGKRQRLHARSAALIQEQADLRLRRLKLPEHRNREKLLKQEAAGLAAQRPIVSDPIQAKLHEELNTARVTLARLQSATAAEKQKLVKIDGIQSDIEEFAHEMRRFFTKLTPRLSEMGVKEELFANFEPAFKGEIEAPLQTIRAGLIYAITMRQSDMLNPADGSIAAVVKRMHDLSEQATADQAMRARIDAIQQRLSAIESEAIRIRDEISLIEGAELQRLRVIPIERLDVYKEIFRSLREEQVVLEGLYGPVRKRLESGSEQEQSLEFYIKWEVDATSWISHGDRLFDQRKGGCPAGNLTSIANDVLVPAWESGDPDKITQKVSEFLERFAESFRENTLNLRTDFNLVDLFSWIFSTKHITLRYGLRYNDVELDKLSPGTKGIVLLILYLGMDVDDSRPLIIDQPEENLDNESIYNLLVHYFRAAKQRRQILVITHNPNLVVNTDAEQIIVATCGRQAGGFPVIGYAAGSLEDGRQIDGIRAQVCRILEGGEPAFLARERRYSLVGDR